MATAPLSSYQVAVTNENWDPLVGVEIEAMVLSTLKPESVVKTGLDGVAVFTGLSAGPHFFKVRARRVSTAVDVRSETEGRVRSYTGQIRLQVIAIGGSGIAKHAVVDAGGFGTHTTIQAAIDYVQTLYTSFLTERNGFVVHINPGTYAENISIALANSMQLVLEAQGGRIASESGDSFAGAVKIKEPTVSTGATIAATGFGRLVLRGLYVTSGASQPALDININTQNGLRIVDCLIETNHTTLIELNTDTFVQGIALVDSMFLALGGTIFGTYNGAVIDSDGLYNMTAEHCHFHTDTYIVDIRGSSASFDHCSFLSHSSYAGALIGANNRSIYEPRIRVVNCKFRLYDATRLGIQLDGGAVANIIGNDFVGHIGAAVGDREGIRLIDCKQATIVGNTFQALYRGVYFAGTVEGVALGYNSFDTLTYDVAAGSSGYLDSTSVIGPDAYLNVTNHYTNIPVAALGGNPHSLLDGVKHTDTVAQAVTAGSIIIGNDTPAWDELAISVPAANVRNVLGIDNGETTPSWKTALDGTSPANVAGAASAGTSLVFAHRDHVHALGIGTTRGDILVWESTPVASRLAIGAAGTILQSDGTDPGWVAPATAIGHALLDGSLHTDSVADGVTAGSIIIGSDTPKWDELVISVPAANVRNILGIDNAETVPSWKTALDGTNPADIAAAASPGTSLVFSHRDHVHAHPDLGDLHTVYLLADGTRDLTGNLKFNDNIKAIFGTGSDAEIYYDGTNLIIDPDAVGSGDFRILGSQHILHTATEDDDHALEIDVTAGGYSDIKGIDIVYVTGTLAAGEDDEAILVNIDEDAANGGRITGLDVLTTTSGSASVEALFVGVGVAPIEQLSGTFGNPDSALVKAADELANLVNDAANTTVFVANSDTMTIGKSAKFEELEFILSTDAGGGGIAPTFEYSTGIGAWAAFSPMDGTNGLRNSGVVAWEDSDIPGWNTGLAGEYLIRITRTRNTVPTTPVVSFLQCASATEFSWSKSGDVIINSLSTDTINERTPAAGVTIESVLLKDDQIVVHGAAPQVTLQPAGGVTPELRLDRDGVGSWDIELDSGNQLQIVSNSKGLAAEFMTTDFGVCRIGQNASDPFSTTLSGFAYALHLDYYVDPSGASATDYYNLELIGKLAGAQNITGSIQNAVYILRHAGTGTLDDGVGITTEYFGDDTAGVTTTYRGFYIKDITLTGSHTVTTFIGIDIGDISVGGVGTVIGIRCQETDVPFQWAGDARFGATGTPAAPVEIIDANFALDIVASNPRLTLDANDYGEYNRASDYLSFVFGSREIVRMQAAHPSLALYPASGVAPGIRFDRDGVGSWDIEVDAGDQMVFIDNTGYTPLTLYQNSIIADQVQYTNAIILRNTGGAAGQHSPNLQFITKNATAWWIRGTDSALEFIDSGGSDIEFKILTTGVYVLNALEIDGDLNHDGSNIGFFGTAPAAQAAAYTPTNVTTDRSYDANATTIDELADILGTLLQDLQSYGLLQ